MGIMMWTSSFVVLGFLVNFINMAHYLIETESLEGNSGTESGNSGTDYSYNGKTKGYETKGKICPPGYFGEPPNCECSVDNIAYMGNNIVMGVNNIQPSKYACQKSCQDNPNCDFWTWGKSGPTKGRCYLKDARENLTPTDDYMSGSKQCKIPNDPGKVNHVKTEKQASPMIIMSTGGVLMDVIICTASMEKSSIRIM